MGNNPNAIKRLSFVSKPKVILFENCEDSKEARSNYWETVARDRVRFNERIERAALIINPVLARSEHRYKKAASRCAASVKDGHSKEAEAFSP